MPVFRSSAELPSRSKSADDRNVFWQRAVISQRSESGIVRVSRVPLF
jgi:hypothetical protein